VRDQIDLDQAVPGVVLVVVGAVGDDVAVGVAAQRLSQCSHCEEL